MKPFARVHLVFFTALLGTVLVASMPRSTAHAAASGSLSEQQIGQAIYRVRCATCHGPNGEGTKGLEIPATAPPLRGNQFVKFAPPTALADVIRNGRNGTERVYDETYADMPSFDASMIEDLRPLIAYMKGDMQQAAADNQGT